MVGASAGACLPSVVVLVVLGLGAGVGLSGVLISRDGSVDFPLMEHAYTRMHLRLACTDCQICNMRIRSLTGGSVQLSNTRYASVVPYVAMFNMRMHRRIWPCEAMIYEYASTNRLPFTHTLPLRPLPLLLDSLVIMNPPILLSKWYHGITVCGS